MGDPPVIRVLVVEDELPIVELVRGHLEARRQIRTLSDAYIVMRTPARRRSTASSGSRSAPPG